MLAISIISIVLSSFNWYLGSIYIFSNFQQVKFKKTVFYVNKIVEYVFSWGRISPRLHKYSKSNSVWQETCCFNTNKKKHIFTSNRCYLCSSFTARQMYRIIKLISHHRIMCVKGQRLSQYSYNIGIWITAQIGIQFCSNIDHYLWQWNQLSIGKCLWRNHSGQFRNRPMCKAQKKLHQKTRAV